jgi:(E)-4-hydroxy-3-methylbut-2-enyl-diphosphate synthase
MLKRVFELPLRGIAMEPEKALSLIPHGARLTENDLTVCLSSGAEASDDPGRALNAAVSAAAAIRKAGIRELLCLFSHDDTTTVFNACRILNVKHGIKCVADLPSQGSKGDRLSETALRVGSLFYENLAEALLLTPAGHYASDWESLEHQVRITRRALGLIGRLPLGYSFISCPTCGRCEIDVTELAGKVNRLMASMEEQYRNRGRSLEDTGGITVAVMGCNVNGPGEAKGADIGIAGGRGNTGTIFMGGKPVTTLPQNSLLEEFEHMLKDYIEERLLQGG